MLTKADTTLTFETLGRSVAIILIIAFLAVLVVLAICTVVINLRDFADELKYLNLEIKRTDGAERKRFKRRKRRLILSLLPFVRY